MPMTAAVLADPNICFSTLEQGTSKANATSGLFAQETAFPKEATHGLLIPMDGAEWDVTCGDWCIYAIFPQTSPVTTSSSW